jgi:hypothetical protein
VAEGRGLARRAFDAFELRLGAGAPHWLRSGMRVAAAAGRLRNRLSGQWPRPDEVQRLFPSLTPGAAARVAREIAGNAACDRFLGASLRQEGLADLPSLLRPLPASFLALRPPAIMGIFHVSLVDGLWPALSRLNGPVAVVRHGHLRPSLPPFTLITTEGGVQSRAAAFLRTLAWLRAGGFALSALDVVPGEGLPVAFLGRTLHLSRGPLSLAMRTGAPIVPMVVRRSGGWLEAEIGEPIVPPPLPSNGRARDAAGERAMACAAAAWFERYLAARPSETGLGLIRFLLNDGSGDVAAGAEERAL